MGHCPCFGFRREKLKRDKNKGEASYDARREAVSKNHVDSRSESSALKGGPSSSNMATTFTYQELAIATNNFSPESFIGSGGFGTVFKGKLERTGQVVAVKQLDPSGYQGDKEFLVEVLMLSLMCHPNLVNLVGFCAERDQRLLVYEYMPLGSLEDHLFDLTPDVEPLDWNTRMQVAAGAARGLDCLHNANPPIIYRDLKASNILLDEGFQPKLSDFGLAKFGPVGDQSHVSTRVMGTYGYCAPEYASTGRLTMKTDIYSYGILLLELITGRRAVDEVNGRQKHLTTWALPLMRDRNNYLRLADPLLGGKYSASIMQKAIEVASLCLSENIHLRPSSIDLVLAMDYLVSRKSEPKEDENVSINRPEVSFCPTERQVVLDQNLERDRAVAEAKMWGESWREKLKQSPQRIPDGNERVEDTFEEQLVYQSMENLEGSRLVKKNHDNVATNSAAATY